MKSLKVFITLVVAAVSVVAIAATPGSSPSFGAYGRTFVQPYDGSTVVYDGGTGSITQIPFKKGMNTVALYNNGITDGGTNQAIYCGWDRLVSPSNGFKIPTGSSLNMDITSMDGVAPTLMCTVEATNQSYMDVRWMVVK